MQNTIKMVITGHLFICFPPVVGVGRHNCLYSYIVYYIKIQLVFISFPLGTTKDADS